MQPEPKKHVSHAIAWSLIALFAGSLSFGIWMYSNQIDTIYSSSANLSVTHKKTTAKPTTATTGTTTTSATADWKTYTNNSGNYSIKYPSGWTPANLTDNTDLISIKNDKVNYSLGIEIKPNQPLSLNDYITSLKTAAAKLISNGQPGDTYGTESNTTIGGQTAIKIANCTRGASAYKYDLYFVKKGSITYEISITKVVGEGTPFDTTDYISTAETMLSTFTFTK